ncbi:branched-chain amino acid ABC transporter permease, partial [Bordetella hinzii]|nr:branched-chain amino acid ABC transporter permease [Bordetella hinzii]
MTELLACFGSASCLVTQASTGLIVGALLFLVAAGLTLIFGVLGVINFAHGSFYMLGAYLGLTVFRLTGSYLAAAVCAGLGVALFALV